MLLILSYVSLHQHNLEEYWGAPLLCPGQCTVELTREDLASAGLDEDKQRRFDIKLQKLRNPNLVDCPSCKVAAVLH
jgi:hypothetical protein